MYRKDNSFWSRTDKNGRNISKLSISAQLQLVYYWCQHFSPSTIIALSGKSSNTVYSWMRMCQEVPIRLFERRLKLGGTGSTVHIDHCLLTQLEKKRGNNCIIFYCEFFCFYYFNIMVLLLN